jgi:hypothetical protein
LSEYSSLLKAPTVEQDRLISFAKSGVLQHRTPCPLVGCKGHLTKEVAFITKDGVEGELFPADVLMCNRKKCDFTIILRYQGG